jgi:Zn-dependent protease
VDGRPAPIYEAYGFLRGVVVDRGRHRVEMHYRPKSVYWGAALTGIGLLAAALIGFSGLWWPEYF